MLKCYVSCNRTAFKSEVFLVLFASCYLDKSDDIPTALGGLAV